MTQGGREVLSERRGDGLEASVKWDRSRRNVYRTGRDGHYDLLYAPGPEARESPQAAAKRKGHTAASEVFEAARWWTETPITDITRTIDGSLPAIHDVECAKCNEQIRGVRFSLANPQAPVSPGGTSFQELCEPCVDELKLTRRQRLLYHQTLHPALEMFEDNLLFCRRHFLYDLVNFLEDAVTSS